MITVKDVFKLIGVVIITFCAVFICTLFLNYNLDLKAIEHLLTEHQYNIYKAKIIMGNAIAVACGGVLGATTVVILIFAIKHYIDTNKPNMGILKALGHSNLRIASSFYIFGVSVLLGTATAFVSAYAFMPVMYDALDSASELPNVIISFHTSLLFALVIIPSIFVAIISIIYAFIKLNHSPLQLINGIENIKVNKRIAKIQQGKTRDISFLRELKTTTLFKNLVLLFFVGFAGFGFSAQIQMSFSMEKLNAGVLFTVILVIIGIILGLVTLLIALSSVVDSNKKYISLLKAYGYTSNECNSSLLGGYRISAYIGFAIGTIYQYVLIKQMVKIFSGTYDMNLEVSFNVSAFFITLMLFVAAYEIIMLFYQKYIEKISLREIMI